MNDPKNFWEKSVYSSETPYNAKVTNVKDIADTLAETFSTNSSSKNAYKQFLNYKDITEKQKLKFKSENTKSYNGFFTLQELTEAI